MQHKKVLGRKTIAKMVAGPDIKLVFKHEDVDGRSRVEGAGNATSVLGISTRMMLARTLSGACEGSNTITEAELAGRGAVNGDSRK